MIRRDEDSEMYISKEPAKVNQSVTLFGSGE